jgi:site-specific DNA recombinase
MTSRFPTRSGKARADAERAQSMLENSSRKAVTPHMLRKIADTARQRIRLEGGGYRRDHLRALAQRVEVYEEEVRIAGSKSRLLQMPIQGLKWRKGWDSNPRWSCPHGGFQDRCLKPLGHPSLIGCDITPLAVAPERMFSGRQAAPGRISARFLPAPAIIC